MKCEIVILVIFFILIVPFSVRIAVDINVLRNRGKITLFLFNFIPIYIQHFEIDNGFIKLIKNPKKIRKIKISFKKDDVKKFNNSTNIILKSQIIKDINIYTKFGVKNCPYYVALISGIYNTIVGCFLSINCAKKNILNSQSKLKTYFKYTYLRSKINVKIRFSIYQILNLLVQLKVGVKT